MQHRPILSLGVVICLLISGIAHAAGYLPNDTTINDNRFSGAFLIAGYSNSTDESLGQNGTSPTITIVEGAFQFPGITGKSGSTINMSGGTVGNLSALENATINLSGGTLSGLNAGGGVIAGSPKANMTGGVSTGVAAQQNGLLTITGGQILSSVQLFDSSVAKISGVTIGQMVNGNLVVTVFDVRNQSTLELNAVTVGVKDIQVFNTANVKLTDTTLNGGVVGLGQNTIEVTGGNMSGGVTGFNIKINDGTLGGGVGLLGTGATATIGGTHASNLSVGSNQTMSVTGSTISGGANASVGGVLTASGTSFAGTVSAFGTSAGPGTIILAGGSAGNLSDNNGLITATDVSITHDVTAQASGVGLLGSITLNGGTVGGNVSATGNLSPVPNALIRIDGSHITGSVTANTRAAITLVSGTVGGDVAAKTGPFSLMDVQGGTITGNATVVNQDTELRISGGTIMGDVRGTNRGTANISAGTVVGNLSSDRAFINLSGGTVQGKWIVTNFGAGTQSGGSVLGDAQFAGVSFTMTGGSIAKNVSVEASSIFTMQNGTIGQAILARNQSNVQMSGGQALAGLGAFGQSTASVSGGLLVGMGAFEQSTLSVSGGSITDVGAVQDTATLNVSGTAIFNNQLNAFLGGTLNFSSGSAKSVGATDQATLNMSGSALILETLSAFKTATVNINGGKVTGDLLANDSSVVAMAGGEVFNAVTEEQSTLIIQGGAVRANLIARNSSIIRLNGGSVTGNASSQDQSTLVLEGTPLIGDGIQARHSSKLFLKGGGVNGDAFADETATLTLSGSGFISGDLEGFATSTLNMSGGGVGGELIAHDNAKLVLSGGNVAGDLTGFNNGDITMSGGTVGGNLEVQSNAKLVLSSGNVAGILKGFSTGDITMTGGTVGGIEANQDQPGGGVAIAGGHVTGGVNLFNSAGLILIGGTVGGTIQAQGNNIVQIESIATVAGSLDAFNSSIVNMRGGSVGVGPSHGNLTAQANATLNLSDGTVFGDLKGFGNSTINMSGGTVFGRGIFSGNSKFNFTGGKILGGISQPPALQAAANEVLNITLLDNASINIQGVDLLATLIDPNHEGTSSLYQLSGLLADGTSVSGGSMVIQNGTAANFTLQIVPHWSADADGNWSNPGNWVQGVPSAPGAVARFLNKITADRTITVDGNFTVGQMVFNDTDRYTLAAAGGSITLQGPAPMINVVGGTHQINSPLILPANTEIAVVNSATLNIGGALSIRSGAALTKTGDGILRVAGPQSHEPNSTLDVSTGTLNLASNAGTPATPAAAASANLAVNINSTVILESPQDLGSLSVSIENEGNQSLDLHSNALRIYSPDLAAAKTSLWAVIQNANANPLDGIFDSTSAAHPGSALGLAQIADAHGDQHIEVRLTRVGDLNLDGTVTIGDFIDLAAHFNNTDATWQEGDVNYDGVVTIGDFIDLISNFNFTFAGESFPIRATDQQALSAFAQANGISAVPEPATLLLLVLPLFRRRAATLRMGMVIRL